jgi:hypothetical protein
VTLALRVALRDREVLGEALFETDVLGVAVDPMERVRVRVTDRDDVIERAATFST